MPGVYWRPVYFQPQSGKYAGQTCQGIQTHVYHRSQFQPVRTALEALAAIKALWPGEFAWLLSENNTCFFDRLAGTDQVRLDLNAGRPPADMAAAWKEELREFQKLRQNYLLYP